VTNLQPFLTPYKYGKPVLTGSNQPDAFNSKGVDCPFVFQHNGQFYMMYVGFDGVGYQTALATSDDLLHWKHKSVILQRSEGDAWDASNIAGTWILKEHELHAPPTLKKWDNKYWLVYHAYPGKGYEEGPGHIGLAWTEDENLLDWHRLPNPILKPADGAEWERGGLYKECLIEHAGTFYLFYNAKNIPKQGEHWVEQTGVALSTNLRDWTRHAQNPVLRVSPGQWDSGFVSDPCILRNENTWAMYFFGFNYKAAQEGIAFSSDLLHWDKHPEPIIRIGQAGDIDSIFAHKPSVIAHNDVLYHFYCACREWREGDPTNLHNMFRTISLATSKPL